MTDLYSYEFFLDQKSVLIVLPHNLATPLFQMDSPFVFMQIHVVDMSRSHSKSILWPFLISVTKFRVCVYVRFWFCFLIFRWQLKRSGNGLMDIIHGFDGVRIIYATTNFCIRFVSNNYARWWYREVEGSFWSPFHNRFEFVNFGRHKSGSGPVPGLGPNLSRPSQQTQSN